MTMHQLAGRRGRAYLWDCVLYLGLAAGTVPIGILINRLGYGADRRIALLVSALPPVAATATATLQEAGRTRATLGKRRERLVVTDARGRGITLSQALIRNTVKILIPWQLGHVVAIGSSYGGFQRRDPLTVITAVATYPLLGAMVAAVTRGDGRALHDRVAGTVVCTLADDSFDGVRDGMDRP